MRRRVLTAAVATLAGVVTGVAMPPAGAGPAGAVPAPLGLVTAAPAGPGAVVGTVPGLDVTRRGAPRAVGPRTVEEIFGGQDVLNAFYAGRFTGWSAGFATPDRSVAVEVFAFRATDPAQAVTLLRRWAETVRSRGGTVETVAVGFPALAAPDHALGGPTELAGLGAHRGAWSVIVVRRPATDPGRGRPDPQLVAATGAELTHLASGGTSLTPTEGSGSLHTAGWVLVVATLVGATACGLLARRRRPSPSRQ